MVGAILTSDSVYYTTAATVLNAKNYDLLKYSYLSNKNHSLHMSKTQYKVYHWFQNLIF